MLFDSERGSWYQPPAHATPFFMRRPKFTSLKTPATWLYILFGLYILSSVIFIPAVVQRSILFDDIGATGGLSRDFYDRLGSSDAYYYRAFGLQVITILLIVPFFLWFTRRATCNVPSLGAHNPDFSPGWAIGWWFVPLANLAQPFRVLSEAWRAADERMPLEESGHFRRIGTPGLLLTWWLTFQISGFALNAAIGVVDTEPTYSGTADALRVIFVLEMAMIAAAVFAIGVVYNLTDRQERANGRFNVLGGLSSLPGSEFSGSYSGYHDDRQ